MSEEKEFKGPKSIKSLSAVKSRRRKKLVEVFVAVAAVLILICGYFYFDWASNSPSSKVQVQIVVKQGETLSGLTSYLKNEGVIRSEFAFKLYLHLYTPPPLNPGTYTFFKPTSFPDLYSLIKKGPDRFTLIVPPGLSVNQIAVRVGNIPGKSASGFLSAVNSGVIRSPYEPSSVNSLEGLLGASNYDVTPNESYSTLINQMISVFNHDAQAAGLTQTPSNGLSAYQTVIVASIVREEAGLETDRPKVARVIFNRLNLGMKLEMDSTVRYAIGDPSRAPTLNELKINSPYNTYLYPGLPPTPISTVGVNDLSAVLNPASGNWLYFVVVSQNGAEAFSSTYSGQLANEALAKSRGLG